MSGDPWMKFLSSIYFLSRLFGSTVRFFPSNADRGEGRSCAVYLRVHSHHFWNCVFCWSFSLQPTTSGIKRIEIEEGAVSVIFVEAEKKNNSGGISRRVALPRENRFSSFLLVLRLPHSSAKTSRMFSLRWMLSSCSSLTGALPSWYIFSSRPFSFATYPSPCFSIPSITR